MEKEVVYESLGGTSSNSRQSVTNRLRGGDDYELNDGVIKIGYVIVISPFTHPVYKYTVVIDRCSYDLEGNVVEREEVFKASVFRTTEDAMSLAHQYISKIHVE